MCHLFLAILQTYLVVAVSNLNALQKEQTPAEQVVSISEELEKERAIYIEKLKKATTTEERNVLMLQAPSPVPYAERMLMIAERNPVSPASMVALLWITKNTPSSSQEKSSILVKAQELILARHLSDPKIGEFAASLTWTVDARNEAMLLKILEGQQDASVRGIVELALSFQWIAQMETIRFQRTRIENTDDPALREAFRRSLDEDFGEETANLIRNGDANALKAKIMNRLEMLQKNEELCSGMWPLQGNKFSIKQIVAQELTRLTTLDVGCSMPSFQAIGLDGENFSLAKHKGKVILLVFSGQWCAACRGLYSVERELSVTFREKPFAMIGVNSDQTIEMAKSLAETEKMEWPIAWDGSPNGPLAEKCRIRSWPLVVLIDHNGIIRHRINGAPTPELLRAIVQKHVSEANHN